MTDEATNHPNKLEAGPGGGHALLIALALVLGTATETNRRWPKVCRSSRFPSRVHLVPRLVGPETASQRTVLVGSNPVCHQVVVFTREKKRGFFLFNIISLLLHSDKLSRNSKLGMPFKFFKLYVL